jgi:hypothetical protein
MARPSPALKKGGLLDLTDFGASMSRLSQVSDQSVEKAFLE